MKYGGDYMKKDHGQIRQAVENLRGTYGFKGPLHFTDFTNLQSIKSSGVICSRNYCHDNKIDFYDVADQGVIKHTSIDVQNCTRFYYKEKTMTLYVNEGIKEDGANPHIPIPVYLLLDEEIIYLDDTIFTDGNAGSQNTKFGDDCEFFNKIMEWDIIFHRDPIYLDEGPEKWEFKRKRQAELLSTQPIPFKYVKSIIFRCRADYKRACNIFGENNLYLVDRNMFNNARNYIKDYNIEVVNSASKKHLLLQYSTNFPVTNHEKHGYELFDMNNNELKKTRIIYPESFSTSFRLKIEDVPDTPFKLRFWFYNILSIEEQIN